MFLCHPFVYCITDIASSCINGAVTEKYVVFYFLLEREREREIEYVLALGLRYSKYNSAQNTPIPIKLNSVKY